MKKLRILIAAAALGAAALAPRASAQDADTPVDRALQQVEALLETLRAQAGTDPKTIQRLEAIAAELRKAKGETGATPPAPGAPAGGGLLPGALDRGKEWFFRGVELKDEERTRADQVFTDFAIDYNLAKSNGDEKSRKVIKEHTQKRLSKGFPSREANKMKENLDGIVEFWEGRWGRGR